MRGPTEPEGGAKRTEFSGDRTRDRFIKSEALYLAEL